MGDGKHTMSDVCLDRWDRAHRPQLPFFFRTPERHPLYPQLPLRPPLPIEPTRWRIGAIFGGRLPQHHPLFPNLPLRPPQG